MVAALCRVNTDWNAVTRARSSVTLAVTMNTSAMSFVAESTRVVTIAARCATKNAANARNL
jgi:hypothetical protein